MTLITILGNRFHPITIDDRENNVNFTKKIKII